MTEKINLRGIFELWVYRGGELIEHYEDKNLIVNAARFGVSKLIGGDVAGRSITQIGFGINGTPPQVTDTALSSQFAKNIGSITYEGVSTVVFNWTLEAAENNGMVIQEFGLLAANGTLFSRKSRQPINKTAEVRLVGAWKIIV